LIQLTGSDCDSCALLYDLEFSGGFENRVYCDSEYPARALKSSEDSGFEGLVPPGTVQMSTWLRSQMCDLGCLISVVLSTDRVQFDDLLMLLG
jgi:hypothetical protein